MVLEITNSRRASPTPSLGSWQKSKASCGLPTFIAIFTGMSRHAVERHFHRLEFHAARVDEPGVAFGAGNRHLRALRERARAVLAAHHRRDPQLARDDRGMAGPSAAVGHDGRGALHHRLPVRIGHVGDQHVAVLHPGDLGDVHDDAHAALADPGADRAPGREHRAALADAVAREGAAALLLALHGLRSRLQHVELAVLAVEAPLDVHRAPVVALDRHGVARELLDVRVGKREALTLGGGYLDLLHRPPGAGLGVEHEADRLGAQAAAHDRGLARGEADLRHVELVRDSPRPAPRSRRGHSPR